MRPNYESLLFRERPRGCVRERSRDCDLELGCLVVEFPLSFDFDRCFLPVFGEARAFWLVTGFRDFFLRFVSTADNSRRTMLVIFCSVGVKSCSIWVSARFALASLLSDS